MNTQRFRTAITVSLFLLISLFNVDLYGQNVGINTTGINPDPSAMLDISASDKGVLIPNVSLTSTTVAAPISNPATSLLVYNVNTLNDVSPGFYYWEGGAWIRISTGISGPLTGDVITSGNAATVTDNAVDGTDISLSGEVNGSVLYFNGTDWVAVAPGTSGQLLQSNGGAAPSWVTKTDKFSIPFSNSVTVQSPGNNSNWFFIGPGPTGLASTAQNATPDRTGAATPNNSFLFYTASSPCKLEKIKIVFNNQLVSRTFSVVAYKYTNSDNATTFIGGTALTGVQNVTTSATAFGNSTITLTGNGTQVNEGDVIVIMLKNGNNAAANLYYSGSAEFSY